MSNLIFEFKFFGHRLRSDVIETFFCFISPHERMCFLHTQNDDLYCKSAIWKQFRNVIVKFKKMLWNDMFEMSAISMLTINEGVLKYFDNTMQSLWCNQSDSVPKFSFWFFDILRMETCQNYVRHCGSFF